MNQKKCIYICLQGLTMQDVTTFITNRWQQRALQLNNKEGTKLEDQSVHQFTGYLLDILKYLHLTRDFLSSNKE